MTSPFASPPPPYSPQHPHVVLDHEKLPLAGLPPPPPPLLPHDMGSPSAIAPGESPQPRGMRARDGDIFHMAPTAALTLLARSVELLVSLTGDVPPTPPISNPNTPSASTDSSSSSTPWNRRSPDKGYFFGHAAAVQQVDGVPFRRHEEPEPPAESVSFVETAHGFERVRSVIHSGPDDQLQHSAISRKFWCRTAPDIPLEDYLFRIHRFCPLSTAVYLAASVYLHRLAIDLRIIPVTPLNVHRLLLAALRIAAKTLEDLSYPHKRFAKVGGLNGNELSRLEISFVYLMNFDLKVNRQMMERQVDILNRSVERQVSMGRAGLIHTRKTPLPSPKMEEQLA